jgi:hypothetical protein
MIKEEKALRDLIMYPCTIKQSDWPRVTRHITALVRAVREDDAQLVDNFTSIKGFGGYASDIAAAIRKRVR